MIGFVRDVPMFILSAVKGEYVRVVVVMEMAGCTVFAVFGGEKLVLLDSWFLQEKVRAPDSWYKISFLRELSAKLDVWSRWPSKGINTVRTRYSVLSLKVGSTGLRSQKNIVRTLVSFGMFCTRIVFFGDKWQKIGPGTFEVTTTLNTLRRFRQRFEVTIIDFISFLINKISKKRAHLIDSGCKKRNMVDNCNFKVVPKPSKCV